MSDHAKDRPGGVTRRTFLGTAGVGALAAAVPEPAAAGSTVTEAGERMPVTLEVNGRRHRVQVQPRATLVSVLREELGLTGTKPGCERGECGACTVLVDGSPRYSCLTLAVEAEGHAVTTVEGLLRGEALGPVQEAFVTEDGFQCGFCTPGQVMAAEGLLRANPRPTLDEIRRAMSGNLCRCGAYAHIFKAVARAAQARAIPGGAR
jgi:xanthine dehydrogenase YagT iron-sulfur-binding subunit